MEDLKLTPAYHLYCGGETWIKAHQGKVCRQWVDADSVGKGK